MRCIWPRARKRANVIACRSEGVSITLWPPAETCKCYKMSVGWCFYNIVAAVLKGRDRRWTVWEREGIARQVPPIPRPLSDEECRRRGTRPQRRRWGLALFLQDRLRLPWTTLTFRRSSGASSCGATCPTSRWAATILTGTSGTRLACGPTTLCSWSSMGCATFTTVAAVVYRFSTSPTVAVGLLLAVRPPLHWSQA